MTIFWFAWISFSEHFPLKKPWCLSVPELVCPLQGGLSLTEQAHDTCWLCTHRPCWEKENIICPFLFLLKKGNSLEVYSNMLEFHVRSSAETGRCVSHLTGSTWGSVSFSSSPQWNSDGKYLFGKKHFGFVAVVLGFGVFSRVLVRILAFWELEFTKNHLRISAPKAQLHFQSVLADLDHVLCSKWCQDLIQGVRIFRGQ